MTRPSFHRAKDKDERLVQLETYVAELERRLTAAQMRLRGLLLELETGTQLADEGASK